MAIGSTPTSSGSPLFNTPMPDSATMDGWQTLVSNSAEASSAESPVGVDNKGLLIGFPKDFMSSQYSQVAVELGPLAKAGVQVAGLALGRLMGIPKLRGWAGEQRTEWLNSVAENWQKNQAEVPLSVEWINYTKGPAVGTNQLNIVIKTDHLLTLAGMLAPGKDQEKIANSIRNTRGYMNIDMRDARLLARAVADLRDLKDTKPNLYRNLANGTQYVIAIKAPPNGETVVEGGFRATPTIAYEDKKGQRNLLLASVRYGDVLSGADGAKDSLNLAFGATVPGVAGAGAQLRYWVYLKAELVGLHGNDIYLQAGDKVVKVPPELNAIIMGALRNQTPQPLQKPPVVNATFGDILASVGKGVINIPIKPELRATVGLITGLVGAADAAEVAGPALDVGGAAWLVKRGAPPWVLAISGALALDEIRQRGDNWFMDQIVKRGEYTPEAVAKKLAGFPQLEKTDIYSVSYFVSGAIAKVINSGKSSPGDLYDQWRAIADGNPSAYPPGVTETQRTALQAVARGLLGRQDAYSGIESFPDRRENDLAAAAVIPFRFLTQIRALKLVDELTPSRPAQPTPPFPGAGVNGLGGGPEPHFQLAGIPEGVSDLAVQIYGKLRNLGFTPRQAWDAIMAVNAGATPRGGPLTSYGPVPLADYLKRINSTLAAQSGKQLTPDQMMQPPVDGNMTTDFGAISLGDLAFGQTYLGQGDVELATSEDLSLDWSVDDGSAAADARRLDVHDVGLDAGPGIDSVFDLMGHQTSNPVSGLDLDPLGGEGRDEVVGARTPGLYQNTIFAPETLRLGVTPDDIVSLFSTLASKTGNPKIAQLAELGETTYTFAKTLSSVISGQPGSEFALGNALADVVSQIGGSAEDVAKAAKAGIALYKLASNPNPVSGLNALTPVFNFIAPLLGADQETMKNGNIAGALLAFILTPTSPVAIAGAVFAILDIFGVNPLAGLFNDLFKPSKVKVADTYVTSDFTKDQIFFKFKGADYQYKVNDAPTSLPVNRLGLEASTEGGRYFVEGKVEYKPLDAAFEEEVLSGTGRADLPRREVTKAQYDLLMSVPPDGNGLRWIGHDGPAFAALNPHDALVRAASGPIKFDQTKSSGGTLSLRDVNGDGRLDRIQNFIDVKDSGSREGDGSYQITLDSGTAVDYRMRSNNPTLLNEAALAGPALLEYVASYPDLMEAYERQAKAAWEAGVADDKRAGYAFEAGIDRNNRMAYSWREAAPWALKHMREFAEAEGRSVSFDAVQYMAANPDVARATQGNPWRAAEHYILFGRKEGRATSPNDALAAGIGATMLENPALAKAYIASHKDLSDLYAQGKIGVLEGALHYIEHGSKPGPNGEPPRQVTFDPLAYLAANPDLVAAFGVNTGRALDHYLTKGRTEGGRKLEPDNPDVLDTLKIMLQNPAAALAYTVSNPDIFKNPDGSLLPPEDRLDPRLAIEHFAKHGQFENRSVSFDPVTFMGGNPDLVAAYGVDAKAATEHLLRRWETEGGGGPTSRLANTMHADAEAQLRAMLANAETALAYTASYPGDLADALGSDPVKAVEQFIKHGQFEGSDGTPRPITFSPVAYLLANPDLADTVPLTASDLTLHFLDSGRKEAGGPRPTEADPDAVRTLARMILDRDVALAYGASHPELADRFGTDALGYVKHFAQTGQNAGPDGAPLPITWEERDYLGLNPDVLAAVQGGEYSSGAEHFLVDGRREGRPSAFDDDLYLARYPDVAQAVMLNEVLGGADHWNRYGRHEGRSELWTPGDEAGYLAANPDVAEAVSRGDFASGLDHLRRVGFEEGRLSPFPTEAQGGQVPEGFDEGLYLAANPDVAQAVASGAMTGGLAHYEAHGLTEGRPLRPAMPENYDEQLYLAANPDVAQAVASGQIESGLRHLLLYGLTEGRQLRPGVPPGFEEAAYLAANPDVAEAIRAGQVESGLRHYLIFGQSEGRDLGSTPQPSALQAGLQDIPPLPWQSPLANPILNELR